ncbi:MAG: hypothetical protein M1812_003217 [Candelaria pacifica]|nr:MAG: hypothetical protein M1812_003217 [Candelaria pacifica]
MVGVGRPQIPQARGDGPVTLSHIVAAIRLFDRLSNLSAIAKLFLVMDYFTDNNQRLWRTEIYHNNLTTEELFQVPTAEAEHANQLLSDLPIQNFPFDLIRLVEQCLTIERSYRSRQNLIPSRENRIWINSHLNQLQNTLDSRLLECQRIIEGMEDELRMRLANASGLGREFWLETDS